MAANAVVNALPEPEWLLVSETEPAKLAELSEDDLLDLHARVRRARTKYVKNYRRDASARVSRAEGRGKARPQNSTNRDRAEVFEEALARVSRALTAAAKASAAELKAERLAAAQAAKAGIAPSARASAPSATARRSAPNARRGDRSTVSPRSIAKGAASQAKGQRRQAKRDAKNAG